MDLFTVGMFLGHAGGVVDDVLGGGNGALGGGGVGVSVSMGMGMMSMIVHVVVIYPGCILLMLVLKNMST
jgi:hypothetical protein